MQRIECRQSGGQGLPRLNLIGASFGYERMTPENPHNRDRPETRVEFRTPPPRIIAVFGCTQASAQGRIDKVFLTRGFALIGAQHFGSERLRQPDGFGEVALESCGQLVDDPLA